MMRDPHELLADHAVAITKLGARVEIFFGSHGQVVCSAEVDEGFPGCLVCETNADDVLIIDRRTILAVRQVEAVG